MARKSTQPASQERIEIEKLSGTERSRVLEPAKRGAIHRFKTSFYQSIVEPLVSSKNSPAYDARAVSIGLVVGFLAPIGTHVISLGLIRMLCRFHLAIAFAFTFVTNPLNVIPVYYGYYYMGSLILGDPDILQFERFRTLVSPVMDSTYFWQALSAIGPLGYEILVRWAVSAVILSSVFGTLGYVITYRIQARRCRRAALKLGIKYEHYIDQLEKNAGAHSSE